MLISNGGGQIFLKLIDGGPSIRDTRVIYVGQARRIQIKSKAAYRKWDNKQTNCLIQTKKIAGWQKMEGLKPPQSPQRSRACRLVVAAAFY